MKYRTQLVALVLFSLLAMTFLVRAQDEGKDKKIKVSEFAPVKDIESQLEYFLGKIKKDLSDKADFGEDQHKRVGLDGSTVAVLALTLGLHDEESELRPAASKLVELANELVDNADSFDDANAAHGELLKAMETKPEGEELSWDEPVADLAMLMQQVPILNDVLRKGVNDKRRFKRNVEKNAARAATLAAIANASMMDTAYCSDEEDEAAWKQICADMRDACAEVYQALLAKDQDKAKAGNAKVVESCDACHHKFRD